MLFIFYLFEFWFFPSIRTMAGPGRVIRPLPRPKQRFSGRTTQRKVAKEAEYKVKYARTDWSQVKLLLVEVFYAAGRLSV